MMKRAESVDAADKAAASQAGAASHDLMPWILAQRARLQAELAEVKAVRAGSVGGAAAGGRRKSTGENTAMKLAGKAEELNAFVEDEVRPPPLPTASFGPCR